MVVDDDQSTCDILAAVLEQEGFTVITANSGEEALELFGVHVFDVVFTDVCMDGMSGLELLERISNMDGSVKTIIMTAHGGFDTVLHALKGGAYDYIEKPIDDHPRLIAIARKAHAYATLERDNAQLLAKLKISHSKLATANEQLLEFNKKLEKLAVTDSLTGLKNRRFVDDVLSSEVALYRRYGSPFSVLMIDIDHFKGINDKYGHCGGDQVLRVLSGILMKNSRTTDTVGRIGGEEFFMLLHGTTVAGAKIVAQRILEEARSPYDIEGIEGIEITVSIGISGVDGSEDLATPEQILDRSDKALYQAKQNGRNRIEYFSVDINAQDGYQAA